MRAESYSFSEALSHAVNDFATGTAPSFLKPFVAGGVSIALEKSATAVRPLACGDPIRRLVAKCFCVGGKDEIEKDFAGRNYGVGCKGGVEVVAHSLRDTLSKFKNSKYGLLKIDFRNAFNEVSRDHFVKVPALCFRQCQVGLTGVTISLRCSFTTTLTSLSLSLEYSKVTLLALFTSVAGSWLS